MTKFDISKISRKLRKGDQVTIWYDGYQIHLKGVGTSNFYFNKKDEKSKKSLDIPSHL